jgi:glucose/arabinose dehydrogenase
LAGLTFLKSRFKAEWEIPMQPAIRMLRAAGLVFTLVACDDSAKVPQELTTGPNPTLPAPSKALFPTINIAPAIGWPNGADPVPASGLSVNAYASGLDHPRWLYVLPNGDVLVAETNKPRQAKKGLGIKRWLYDFVQEQIGAGVSYGIRRWIYGMVEQRVGAGVPSADRITLLRDADGDGVAELKTVFLPGLHSPLGMALVGHDFYVANTHNFMRFPYSDGETQIKDPGVKVMDLPAGRINLHWTRNIVASRDGLHLYVAVGANSDAAENGLDAETGAPASWR